MSLTKATSRGRRGKPGKNGAPANTLVGQVTMAEGGALAIAAGIRQVPVALSGVVAGERYAPFCRSYKLNGGTSAPGCPTQYTMLDARCNANGTVIITVNAPLLALGSSYEFKVDIVKVNT